jgi:hypothetical protein
MAVRTQAGLLAGSRDYDARISYLPAVDLEDTRNGQALRRGKDDCVSRGLRVSGSI